MTYHIIVPAAGAGSRFGASTPKQYLALNGRPVLQHTLERLRAGFPQTCIHVVLAPQDHWFEEVIEPVEDVHAWRCGGSTRAQSVRNGMLCLHEARPDDWVIVHDAVRPCLDIGACMRLRTELAHHAVGGLLAIPVSDTMKRVDASHHVVQTEPRQNLWRAQTPQMFRQDVLSRALAAVGAEQSTDEAHAVEHLGLTPRVVVGSARNVKITYAEDIELAGAILTAQDPEPATVRAR